MDDQSLHDLLNDLALQKEDSGSETDEELASKVAVECHDMHHMLFTDAVSQSAMRLHCDESDFVVDIEHSFEIQPGGADTRNKASELNQSGACQLPELLEDMEVFSGPAEWRHVWEWEMGECNRMTAEQNTQQYDEAEICMDSDDSAVDDAGSDCVSDLIECHIQPCLPCRTLTVVGDSEDMANAVSASLVVNEPVFCSQYSEGDRAGVSSIYDSESCDSNAIQCVIDDVVKSCTDDRVMWDSEDESGLTELDKQNCSTGFSRDFSSDNSEARVLSTCIPFSRSANEHHDLLYTEDRCSDNGFTAGFAGSSMFAQRSSYSSGAHCRPVDSKWNPSRTPPTSETDSCRWKPKKKSWRKNSAGNTNTEMCILLTNLDKG